MQAEVLNRSKMTETDFSVFNCLAYFDVFNYPLTIEEIVDYCGCVVDTKTALNSLKMLLGRSLISNSANFYFLSSSPVSNIEKRLSANSNALLKGKKARSYSKLIAKFPFVESLSISGSFSKGILEKDGDIDYFIITKPGRLWICRSLLIAFKKIFLLNSHKYFCVNYFVDAENLFIPDRNIFVATEIKTLLPVYNRVLFDHFLNSNAWTNDFLPNKKDQNYSFCNDQIKKPSLSRWIEKLLSAKIGEKIDDLCFKITLKRWNKKFPEFSLEDFDLNLRTRKNVSKHHPRGFQKKVLEAYSQKINSVSYTS